MPSAAEIDTSAAGRELGALLQDYFQSVERRDLEKFLSFFSADEHFTVFEDQEMRNRRAFVAFAREFFGSLAELSLTLESYSVDSLAPDVAVATGVFHGEGKTSTGEAMSFRHAFTFILAKDANSWRIRHVHESSLGA